MNYYQFEAEDFAADDYFKKWVYLPDAESNAFWEEFLKDYPERYYQLNNAKILVLALRHVNKKKADEAQVARLWSWIEETVDYDDRIIFKGRLKKNLIWTAAASVLLLIGFGLFQQNKFVEEDKFGLTQPPVGQWTEASNSTETPIKIQLIDGSKIWLEKNSYIRYNTDFEDSLRVVYLNGTALFEVHKNPSKPFLVYSNDLVTKVLGTTFLVQANEKDPDVTVSVKTGKVSVYSRYAEKSQDPEVSGIVLTPNQKAIFQRDIKTLSKTIVPKPLVLVGKSDLSSFVFEDASAATVFHTLEQVYGLDVIFDEELMRNCTLTVNISKEDLFQKLEVICKVLDVNYKLINAQVIIYSKGCS
jgi:transmembrane sensor